MPKYLQTVVDTHLSTVYITPFNFQTTSRMAQRTRPRRGARTRSARMVFEKKNYQLLALGVMLVVIGFTAMRMENEVDGVISLYLSPLVVMAGYIAVLYAILWRPKTPADSSADTSASKPQS